jgi:5-methylcytosine-specific restriction endonuclease McrA
MSQADQTKKAAMRTTLKNKRKTHPGVLPQFRALKVPVDVTGKAKPGRAETSPRSADQAGLQHGRGERPKGLSPSLQGEERSGVTRVFVRASNGTPLMPCHAARARQLLRSGRARVHKLYPFAIRLTDRKGGDTQPVVLKVDPGATTTGLALNRQELNNISRQTVLHLAELTHRGTKIRASLVQRRGYRRRRRSANLRHRAPRFDNRTRPEGWLPPSLQSRVDNIVSWQRRYSKIVPIGSIEIESVRFDLQKLENPEISGKEYQQGTLAGYELREYLLEKWGRKCAYCGASGVPLQLEHINPRNPRNRFSPKGSDRSSNLTLACDPCNKAKGNRPIEDFLANQPEKLKEILNHTRKPLDAAASVNATRLAIFRHLREVSSIPIARFSGGRTKFNRSKLGIPKTHALDAACVGELEQLNNWKTTVLRIKATGRGSYQRTRVTKDGFPRGYLPRSKTVHGFRTGDLITAIVPSGKKAGTYTGRVAVRLSGSFNIQTKTRTMQGISHRHCRRILAGDGYSYHQTTIEAIRPTAAAVGFLA